jgi:TolB protein
VSAEGTGERRLTSHPGKDETPAFSPDGARIVFQSDRGGSLEVYVMDPDGARPRRLSPSP